MTTKGQTESSGWGLCQFFWAEEREDIDWGCETAKTRTQIPEVITEPQSECFPYNFILRHLTKS